MRNILLRYETSSDDEAILNSALQVATTQKFVALYANHTWSLITLPAEKRWIYKVKHKANEIIERFKDRLVVKEYTQ